MKQGMAFSQGTGTTNTRQKTHFPVCHMIEEERRNHSEKQDKEGALKPGEKQFEY